MSSLTRRVRFESVRYILMVEAVRISETSVCLSETTWRCIPQDCYLHTALRIGNRSSVCKVQNSKQD
jgi:hypothetical protein